jgi:hypothetical protein
MASNMGAQKARAMKSGSGSFDIDDFVSKLVTFMGGAKQLNVDDDSDAEDAEGSGAPLEWDRIGRKALAKSRRVPAMGFMQVARLPPLIALLSSTSQARPALDRTKETDVYQTRQIREGQGGYAEAAGDKGGGHCTRRERDHEECRYRKPLLRPPTVTSHPPKQLEALLGNEDGPVNLFTFVINPNDFAQSVENIFYLSFLIRDGKVALETQDDGQVVICTPIILASLGFRAHSFVFRHLSTT